MFRRIAVATATVLAVSGCSLIGSGDTADNRESPSSTTTRGAAPTKVVLLTHDSWSLPKKLVKRFEQNTGFELTIRSSGDAGTLTNKLVLSKDHPEGDVAFGVDNTFASRALDEGVFAKAARSRPTVTSKHLLAPDVGDELAAIDYADVCVNIDTDYFESQGLNEPTGLGDLTKPAYRDLFVVPAATTSSPGLAFLLATIAKYEDEWPTYWADLMKNGTKVTSGWSDAYYVDFTAGGGKGSRPIVLSYDSSPAFTLSDDGTRSTTRALLDTCIQQVEYAGVLANAKNPEGAEAVIQWLLSEQVQAKLPTSMYVFPVRDDVELPADWAKFAQRPGRAYVVDPAEIAANRQQWLTEWQDVTSK